HPSVRRPTSCGGGSGRLSAYHAGVPMILQAASAALGRLFTPPFRAVFFKTLGLTILALIGSWFAIGGLFDVLALPPLQDLRPDLPAWSGWLRTTATFVAGRTLALGLGLLIAPVGTINA